MKRVTISFAVGLLTGAILFGGTAVYAASVMAERSADHIFVDGREAQMEAYTINGNNYVRLSYSIQTESFQRGKKSILWMIRD